MKIWTLTTEVDYHLMISLFVTLEAAERHLREFLDVTFSSYGAPFEGDTSAEWAALIEDRELPIQFNIDEHDLTNHPAIREARATLGAVEERLHMNNYGGEEDPFIQDINTALEMLK